MRKARPSFIFFFELLTFCFWLLTVPSCNTQALYHPGGPYYYERFATYKIPFQPINELTQEEVKLRESYFVAYFDNNGKIISFTKYLRGEKFFDDRYIYNSNRLLERREITKSTGEVIIQFFDKKGNIIKTEVKEIGNSSSQFTK